jgi:hypothetical protein
MPKCIEENCKNKNPSFNLPTEIIPILCSKHKKENMINIKSKKCIEENCMIIPVYNLANKTKPIYCNEHKKENMVDIISKKCNELNCIKIPNFNLPNKSNPLFCNEHKKENMINISSKRCLESNCKKIPSYNIPTKKNSLYCVKHKKENMINVRSNRCVEDGCMNLATFNLSNKKTRLYCIEHKKDNMINIKKYTLCMEKNCILSPTFNIPTETKPLYCNEHKKINMVNIISKICIEEGCITRAGFSLPIDKKPLYCYAHKKENMVSIKTNKCQSSKCKENPIFGLLNKRPQFCFKHKKPNMINLVLENKCSILECNEEYDNIIDTIKYCNEHIPEKYTIDVKRICKYCDIKEESKFICKNCKKIQNKKEWAIVRHLRKEISIQFEYNSSKMLQGCSKKRPDVYFELTKHCVIVEIDENQHNTYGESCECARINEIVNGIGGKSVIIIRYNPDVVKNKDKVLTIKQSDKIDLLVKTIKDELVKDYDTFIVKTIQLFYNDDYEEYKKLKEENITDLVCV